MKGTSQVVLLLRQNLIATISGSIGSEMFRHLWVKKNGEVVDLLRNGQVSCAYYVSTILSMPNFGLLPKPHATVAGLVKGLEDNGWRKRGDKESPQPGDVLIWEPAAQAGGELHGHAGFCMGLESAISHVDSTRSPQEHHSTFGVEEDNATPRRRIIAIYTHPALV